MAAVAGLGSHGRPGPLVRQGPAVRDGRRFVVATEVEHPRQLRCCGTHSHSPSSTSRRPCSSARPPSPGGRQGKVE
eukprot:2808786-Heterocapsa_arctica.AAC.1